MPDPCLSDGLSPASPGYFDERVFIYRFLPADQSVANLARRFHVEETAIWTLNGRNASWIPASGELLQIPRPPEMRFGDFIPPGCTWQQFDVEESTSLSALLQMLSSNGHLGSFGNGGAPGSGEVGEEETLAIWQYWRNAKLREDVLRRSPDANGVRDSDWANLGTVLPILDIVESKGGSAALLNPADVIFLPLTPLAQHEVAVAPGAPATVDLTPTLLEKVRRRLSEIHSLLQTLMGLRAEAQRVQAECTACLRILRQLIALVQVEIDQSAGRMELHPELGDDGRGKLKAALETLADEATAPMTDNPIPTVSPGFPARWQRTMRQLLVELKNAELRQLLDQAVPQYGEMVCVIDGVRDRKNFVETLCSLAAQAAYWIAEMGDSEGTKLLNDAVIMMASGAKPTAGSTSSLLDYAAALPGAGTAFSPSCAGSAAYAYCGVVTNLYISAGLASASLDPNVCANNVRSAVGALLGIDPNAYWIGDPPLASAASDGSLLSSITSSTAWSVGSSVKDSVGTVTGARKDRKDSQTPYAEEDGADEDASTIAEFREKTELGIARKYTDFAKSPEKILGPLAGPIGNIRSLWGVLKKYAALGTDVAAEYKASTPAESLKAALHVGKDGFGAASSTLKLLKDFGILEEQAIKRTVAVLGRVSMVLSIVMEAVESYEAFAAHDPKRGWCHLGLAIGIGIMATFPGGQVILVIGEAVFVLASIINSAPGVFTLDSVASQFFTKSFQRFERTGSKFGVLHPAIRRVHDAYTDKTLPVLEPLQYVAYEALLTSEGIASTDITN